jgi:hypothetical protein
MGTKPQIRIPLLEAGAVAAQKLLTYNGRPLGPEERKLLLGIFGDSVNLDLVEIAFTDLGPKGRPYTFGNTIRVPRGTKFDAETLVHEMTHVWQYQTRGTGYISDSSVHQLISGNDAYVFELEPGKSFYDYTAEQEAMIVERYYADSPPGWSTSPDVLRMIEQVRSARPLSSIAIQQDTWFGPNRPWLDNDPGANLNRGPQTVPLIRIEF